ncbi:MAG: hypothetical protein K0R57_818 [Paenibacillaceae bacterium]|nr:hypothetical protein [Paenibacillaceae bacterium]
MLVLLSASLLLSGCWDMKEAQNINFITALGVDYADNRYIVYAQIIDFTNISKREGDRSNSNSSPVWVGKGEGKTILQALNEVYDSSQQQTLWTHVKAIILSERVLESKMADVFSGLLRSREMRYTPWVYGTSSSIPGLLSSVNLLNQSAQTTEMFEPTQIYKQRSDVEPVHLQKLLNGVREPGSTVLLPSICSQNEVWTIKGERPALIRTNGAYVISDNTSQGYVPEEKLYGARYVKFRQIYSYPMPVITADGKNLLFIIRNPRTSVSMKPGEDAVSITIKLQTNINLLELEGNAGLSQDQLKTIAAEKLREQFTKAMDLSRKLDADIFGFEEHLYRYHNKYWKMCKESGKDFIPLFELKQVEIDLEVRHSNAYNVL